MRTGRFAVILVLASLLADCAARPAAPLASAPDTHREAAALSVDTAKLRLDPLKPIVINPADGFSPEEVAVLAVLNNADLTAKRAARGVSAAQVFAAGLLPDPQIAASFDHPVAGPDPLNAYSVSPSLDLAALLTHSASRHAAESTSRQGDLDLLWAEWGVAQQARQQSETVLAAQTRQASLRSVLAVAAARADRSGQALARGDVTSQTAGADLVAKLEAQAALTVAETDEAKARAELAGLLNLDAGVRLPLVADRGAATYDGAAIQRALADLPSRRPDLLALQAGYQAQDLNVRVAALNRFPLTQISFAFARDTAGSVTRGIATAFALPLFNGGRGALAIQTATREQLRAEYQARLDQTEAEVQAAQGDLARSQARVMALAADQPALDAALAPAEAAYGRGDLDSQAYLSLTQTALSKRADVNDAQLQARLAEIQLETLLFLPPLPPRSQP